MKIDLTEIYAGLQEWTDERRITAESQKGGYIVNVMEEMGELAAAIRAYEKLKNEGLYTYAAEHAIIDSLCDTAVLTINAGADLPSGTKPLIIEPKREISVADIYIAIADFIREDYDCFAFDCYNFGFVLKYCASVCESYGYNFELAMLQTIKEISSRTGSYDESAGKWIKDTSAEARAKWHEADYNKARIKDE